MFKLSKRQQEVLDELERAQDERRKVPEQERFYLADPKKFAAPLGIADADAEPSPATGDPDDEVTDHNDKDA